MRKHLVNILIVVGIWLVTLFALPTTVSAHCDTLDGPVVSSARKSLGSGNVNYSLIWVKPENENEIRKALKKARDKRKRAKTVEDRDKVDMEFFEILVRVHREGEGAKYEGIKPAGSVEPEIAIADNALASGNIDEVIKHIKSLENQEIITHLFKVVKTKSTYSIDDLDSGREFVKSYAFFIHAVEKAIKGEIIHIEEHHNH